LSSEKKPAEPIKVTDKRIFTSDGDIREEFKNDVHPVDPEVTLAAPRAEAPVPQEESAEKKKTVRDKATNPGTPFGHFVESLIVNAYMALGMLRDPRDPHVQARADMAAARQMIDILTVLTEKTAGNLTEDEDDYLKAHLGELKLAFVQRGKTI
jgi:hypothetical protein